MKYNLTIANAMVEKFKLDHGIVSDSPHQVSIEVWKHRNSPQLKLECKVSLFIRNSQCMIGTGITFSDALSKIHEQLRPNTLLLRDDDEVEVESEE